MTRTEILNFLINKNKYKNYLEIGVLDQKFNFDKINCDYKEGVDPNGSTTHTMSSDEFFSKNKNKFDLIFIDGLHLEEQVDRDIKNSLKCLNKNGTIVLHDCLPYSEWHQRSNYGGKGNWAGTVWRSVAKLRMMESNLDIKVVDTDFGCGIIRKTLNSNLFPQQKLTYTLYKENRDQLMNVINCEQFKDYYG